MGRWSDPYGTVAQAAAFSSLSPGRPPGRPGVTSMLTCKHCQRRPSARASVLLSFGPMQGDVRSPVDPVLQTQTY